MEWVIHLLRQHSELAIFLTIAAGFWIGKMKIKQIRFFSFIPFCYRIQSGTTILSLTEKRWFTSSRIRRAHVCRLFDYHLVISYLNGI